VASRCSGCGKVAVTGDLSRHCIGYAMWLNGSIDSVAAVTETFIKERKHNLTGEVERSALMTRVHS